MRQPHHMSSNQPRTSVTDMLRGLVLVGLVAAASGLALQACVPDPPSGLDDGQDPLDPSPTSTPRGSITATVSATGPEAPDTLLLSFGDGSPEPVATNGSRKFPDLAAGMYTVALDGLPENCAVEGANPRDVPVPRGADVETDFGVTCTATVGAIRVTATTHGDGTDDNGYRVELDDKLETRVIGVNGSHTFDALAPGEHEVRLRDVRKDCKVEGEDRVSVNVVAGEQADVDFTVECSD